MMKASIAPMFESIRTQVRHLPPVQRVGAVTGVAGLIIESDGPNVGLGELCLLRSPRTEFTVRAEVVGFREHRVLLMPLGETNGLHVGCEVAAADRPPLPRPGPEMLGRVLDAFGYPIDGQGLLPVERNDRLNATPPHPLKRARIHRPLDTGVRALDAFTPIGYGQRLGLFAGSGVGKSTLLGMIARNTTADLNVICLVGERGREVRDFIERDLGPEGLARSIVVVATSDQPALQRLKAAFVATAIAEHFRDQGQDVMLMMDSVTRFAMAQREVGLAIGEPPATKGYTPSVFAILPKLLERAGTAEVGSITALYTVLVEGDDLNEPISDTVRGILDGHVVLSRELAEQNHYPAIDVLGSISRVMVEITEARHQKAAGWLREVLATHKNAQDLINIGAYQAGSNPEIDAAIALIDPCKTFLRQAVNDPTPFGDTVAALESLFAPLFAAEG